MERILKACRLIQVTVVRIYDAFRCNKYLYKCKGKSFDTFPHESNMECPLVLYMFPLVLSLVGYARLTFIIHSVILVRCARRTFIIHINPSWTTFLLKNTLVGDHLTHLPWILATERIFKACRLIQVTVARMYDAFRCNKYKCITVNGNPLIHFPMKVILNVLSYIYFP